MNSFRLFAQKIGDRLLAIDARLIPPGDEIVPREILQIITRRLGMLYTSALIILWITAARFYAVAPRALSVGMPLVLSALVSWRMYYWHRVRHHEVTTPVVLQSIRKLQFLGPIIGLAFSVWGLTLFPYGDAMQQDMLPYLTVVTALLATLCLCATPVASILLMLALMAPQTFALLAAPHENALSVAGIQLMLIVLCVCVAFAYQKDFLALIDAKRLILESEKRLKVIAERETLLATVDPLTGLLNRRAILSTLESSVNKAAIKLAMIDLDGFKDINDSLGHLRGDAVLREIASRLVNYCPTCVVGRLGGDEFALVFPSGETVDRDRLIDIVMKLSAPLTESNSVVGVGASLGYFESDDAGLSLEDCLERADQAMYAAKASPGSSIAIYGDELDAQVRTKHKLISAVSAPNFEQFLSLAYQPIINLAERRVVGVESLCRWSSPEFTTLSASNFISMAESCDQINAVTLAIVRRAVRECRAFEHGARLYLNISARDLIMADVMDSIDHIVLGARFPPGAIVFELTETAFVNLEGATKAMARMRARGYRFALDDFGTGQSSLNRVHRLPIEVIKVDGELIENVASDRRCRAAVGTVLELANQLEVDCVVEGVETAEQALHVQRLGARLVQGYFFCRPTSASDALAFNENLPRQYSSKAAGGGTFCG